MLDKRLFCIQNQSINSHLWVSPQSAFARNMNPMGLGGENSREGKVKGMWPATATGLTWGAFKMSCANDNVKSEPVLLGQSEKPALVMDPSPGHSTGKAKSSQHLHSPTPRLLKFRPRTEGWHLEHSLERRGVHLGPAPRKQRAKVSFVLESPHSAALPSEAVAPAPFTLAAARMEERAVRCFECHCQ